MSNAFDSIIPTDEQTARIIAARDAFKDLADALAPLVGTNREASVMMTNLETAAMWATKAISRHPAPKPFPGASGTASA